MKKPKKNKLVTLKCEPELYERFKEACYDTNIATSKVLREYMEIYIKKHAKAQAKKEKAPCLS